MNTVNFAMQSIFVLAGLFVCGLLQHAAAYANLPVGNDGYRSIYNPPRFLAAGPQIIPSTNYANAFAGNSPASSYSPSTVQYSGPVYLPPPVSHPAVGGGQPSYQQPQQTHHIQQNVYSHVAQQPSINPQHFNTQVNQFQGPRYIPPARGIGQQPPQIFVYEGQQSQQRGTNVIQIVTQNPQLQQRGTNVIQTVNPHPQVQQRGTNVIQTVNPHPQFQQQQPQPDQGPGIISLPSGYDFAKPDEATAHEAFLQLHSLQLETQRKQKQLELEKSQSRQLSHQDNGYQQQQTQHPHSSGSQYFNTNSIQNQIQQQQQQQQQHLQIGATNVNILRPSNDEIPLGNQQVVRVASLGDAGCNSHNHGYGQELHAVKVFNDHKTVTLDGLPTASVDVRSTLNNEYLPPAASVGSQRHQRF